MLETEVLIVGAGPVGLLSALALAQMGVEGMDELGVLEAIQSARARAGATSIQPPPRGSISPRGVRRSLEGLA